MKGIFTFTCLYLGLTSMLAQETIIHFDKPYYLSGEYMFYAFCNAEIPSDSTVARVDLYNNDRLASEYYLRIVKGCADGHIKLTHELPTGVYSFQISVFDALTLKANTLLRKEIQIFNDADRAILSEKAGPVFEPGKQEIYAPNNGPWRWELPGQKKIKRVSVAIRDHSIYRLRGGSIGSDKALFPIDSLSKGIPFYGKRINSGAVEIYNPLIFALNPVGTAFTATQVDRRTNDFRIALNPFYNKQPISFLDYLDDSVKVARQPSPPRPITREILSVDSTMLEHIRVYREEKKINQLFRQLALEVEHDSMLPVRPPIKPNFSIDVQDYEIRGTVVTLFKEVLAPLKFKAIGKGEYRARMLYERNNIKKYYSRPPLFLVNGRATRNGPFMAKLPLQDIARFKIYSLYDELEKLAPIALGGIVYVDMMDPNYEIPDQITQPIYEVQGLQDPIMYPVEPVRPTEDAPLLGSLLYWNPDVAVSNGQLEIDFTRTDGVSSWEVEVVMHLQDGGIEIKRMVYELPSAP